MSKRTSILVIVTLVSSMIVGCISEPQKEESEEESLLDQNPDNESPFQCTALNTKSLRDAGYSLFL